MLSFLMPISLASHTFPVDTQSLFGGRELLQTLQSVRKCRVNSSYSLFQIQNVCVQRTIHSKNFRKRTVDQQWC